MHFVRHPQSRNHFTVSNASGVTLGNSVTVNGTLTLTSGRVTTDANVLIIANSSSSSVVHGSGYVAGNLRWALATGAQTRTFDVGSAAGYAPVTLSFNNITAMGDITVSSTSGDNPNLATSAINPALSVRGGVIFA